MTEADKKQVQKMIDKAVKDAAATISGPTDEDMRADIHAEINKATGRRYGRWECECGLNGEPFYLDPMRIAHAMCKCGKQRNFVPLP